MSSSKVFINIPARQASVIKVGCATVARVARTTVAEMDRIEIKVPEVRDVQYRELAPSASSVGSALDKTPIKPLSYAVRTGWGVLQDYCRSMPRCDKCAYISWGPGSLIAVIAEKNRGVSERGDLLVLFPVRGLQYERPPQAREAPMGRAWPIVILQRGSVDVRASRYYDVVLEVGNERYTYVAVAESAEHMKIFTRHAVNEIHTDPPAGGLVVKSLLEKVWLGSTPVVAGIGEYVQYPAIVLYDMLGVDLPRRVYSASGVRVEVSLSDIDARDFAKQLMQSNRRALSALVKVLANNIFAKELLSTACRECLNWVFEREYEINARATGRVIFTSPIFSRIATLYDELMFNARCSPNAQSVLGRYENVLRQIASRRNMSCDRLSQTVQLLRGFIDGASGADNPVSLAFVTVAALLGGHGVAHLISKALGFAERNRVAEIVRVHLSSSTLSRVAKRSGSARCSLFGSLQPGTCIGINGIFEVCSRAQEELLRVEVSVWDVSGSFSGTTRQDLQSALVQRLRMGGRDRCELYEEEETRRLDRVWNFIKPSQQGRLPDLLDSFLSRTVLPECPQPPRELFRYMLPDAVVKACPTRSGANCPARSRSDAVRQIRRTNRELQYVYPRHVKFCNDGCHICVLAPRGACQLPPLQESMWTSKTLALYLLKKAGLIGAQAP